MNSKLEEQEYSGFRHELITIIQARYTILALTIAAVGVITGFIVNQPEVSNSASGHSLFSPFTIQILAPALYALVIVPSIVITLLLTVHFRRIDAYLWARYERSEGLLFQRAYNLLREKAKFKSAYTIPLTLTYFILCIGTVSISLIVNWDNIIHSTKLATAEFGLPIGFIVILLITTVGFFIATITYAGRNLTKRFRAQWIDSLNRVEEMIHSRQGMAVFLDRDGVINVNRTEGVTSVNKFEFIPKAKKALAKMTQEGLVIIVVSNQPYIDDNKMTYDDLQKIHNKMQKGILLAGGHIRRIYTCPHTESSNCCCRKPKTELFERAATDFGIDLKKSWMIGDQISDIEAGNAIGARTILVRTGEGKKTEKQIEDNLKNIQVPKVVDDILEAAKVVIRDTAQP